MSNMMESLLAARVLPVNQNPRYKTNIPVIDEIFTSLDVAGLETGVYVLGGDPGAGKSTFFLQLMNNLALAGHITVYAAYEGKPNITGIIRRMALDPIISIVDDTNPGWESDTDQLCESMRRFAAENDTGKPLVLCIDSIKNLDSGSVAARKKAIKKLHETAHETKTILFLIAHATKESQGKANKKLEGPSELTGQADVVMYLINNTPADRMKGSRNITLDIQSKNRFGETGQFRGFMLRESGFDWPLSKNEKAEDESFVHIQIPAVVIRTIDEEVDDVFRDTFGFTDEITEVTDADILRPAPLPPKGIQNLSGLQAR